MPDDHESIINTDWPRRVGVLKLTYIAVDDAGVARATWGLEVKGDLPLDPRGLRREVERLPWPDGFPHEHGSPEVHQFEYRGAAEEVVHFVVEATPEAFYGAAVAAGLGWLCKLVKPFARGGWMEGPNAAQTQADILVFATKQAKAIAYDTYRDIEGDLVVVSQSSSQPAKLDDASAMIVLRASDGSTISVHLWLADEGVRHTSTRVFPE